MSLLLFILITFNIAWLILIDFFIDLECFLEWTHSAVAWSNHESPFDFFRLNLWCSLKEMTSTLIVFLLHIVDAQPSYRLNIRRQEPIWFRVIVQSLCLIFVLGEKANNFIEKIQKRFFKLRQKYFFTLAKIFPTLARIFGSVGTLVRST